MTSIESNSFISLVLAHSLVYFARDSAPAGYDCYNGGGPDIQNTSESTDSILKAYVDNLPALVEATSKSYTPLEQARLAAEQATSPGQAALTSSLYSQYGPQLSSVSDAINAASAQAQAQSDLNVIRNTGRDLVNEGVATQKIADPEYYASREAAGKTLQNLYSSLDPTQLSGSERAEMERSLNQQNQNNGTANTNSAINTAANAMSFGNALTDKQLKIASILGGTANTLESTKSGIDAFQVATGKPSRSNLGDSKFTNPTVSSDASSLSNNFLSGLFGQKAAETSALSNQKDTYDKIGSITSSIQPA